MWGKTTDTARCRYAFAKLEITLLQHPNNDTNRPEVATYLKEVPTSLTLYIFAMIYWLYLTWDALRLKNTIQVIGLCISNFALVVYGAVQTKQVRDIVSQLSELNIQVTDETQSQINPGLIANPIVLAVGAILMCIVARKQLYEEFSWTIYKNISADMAMRRRFLTYQVRSVPSRADSQALPARLANEPPSRSISRF